ncbi:MAG: signal peptide peptidase SppA [Spirochaetota bacterium]
MKSIFAGLIMLSALFLLTPVSASAQDYPAAPHSVATADNFLAPSLNPAALGVGNSAGLGLTSPYTRKDLEQGAGAFFSDYGLFINGYHLAYSFNKLSGTGHHNVALGVNPVINNYFGFGLGWRKGEIKVPRYTFSVLSRPLDAVSLGGTVTMQHGSSTDYRLGLGLRPLFFTDYLTDRVSVAADLAYKGREWKKPLISLHTEVADGVFMDTGYDFENDSVHAQVSFAFPHLQVGSLAHFRDTGDFQSGEGFFFLSAARFRSLCILRGRRFAEYPLEPAVVEQPPGPDIPPFTIIEPAKTIQQVIVEIQKLKQDPSVRGIVFINQNFAASFANYMEIRNALEDFKSAGKQVVFYYETADNLNYAFAASVADRIYLQPQGYISLTGIAAARPYLEGFLDMVGVEVVNLKSHPYKTSYNILSESEMTDAERTQLSRVVESLYRNMTEMITSGRKQRLARPIDQIINEGPYLEASRALEAGLVDGIIYQDQLEEKLQELLPGAKTGKYFFTRDLRYDWSISPKNRVAIIYAAGPIHTGETEQGTSIGSETVARAIKQARKDPFISGIILRVSSRGGSAVAADVIAREIALTVNGDNPKPVVVSMGDTAASGGYYISSPATKIVAQPVTITGSIGVVAVFPNIVGLSRKLKVNWETIKKGRHADMGALYRRMSPEEKKIVQGFLHSTYQKFVEVVSEGREMNTSQVEEAAQGKVWTGEQAKEKGLIDHLGGLREAIGAMQLLLGAEEGVQLVEVSGEKPLSVFNQTRGLVKTHIKNDLPPEMKAVVDAAEGLKLYGDEAVLMIAPYYFGVEK